MHRWCDGFNSKTVKNILAIDVSEDIYSFRFECESSGFA